MNVRKFQKSDKDALVHLWESVFPDDPPHNAPSAVIESKLAVDDLIFIAESGGSLIGACMAGYDGHRGWLYSVAVLEEHRRGGVGAALVNHAVASLKAQGCIKVNLQIRPTNPAVAEFYESLGFETEERISMGKRI